jgi:hypothetical protein
MRWLPGSLATPTRQPLGGARVSRANPLARGIVEGLVDIGGTTVSLTGAPVIFGADSSAAPRRAFANGIGTETRGAGGVDHQAVNVPARSLTELTVMCLTQRTGTPQAFSGPFGLQGAAGPVASCETISGSYPATSALISAWNSGGTRSNASTASGVNLAPLDVMQVVIMRVVNSVMTLHLDGVQVVSGAGPAAIQPVTSMEKGRSQALGTLRFAGIQPLMVFWDRGLTDAGIGAVSRNPWQIIAPIDRPLWAPASTVTVYRPGADVSGTWTPVGGASVAATLADEAQGNYAESPDLTSPQVCTWNPPLPAGNWTLPVGAQRTDSTGQVRIVCLDAGGASVGATAWQTLTLTPTLYSLSVNTSAVSTQFRIEVQP